MAAETSSKEEPNNEGKEDLGSQERHLSLIHQILLRLVNNTCENFEDKVSCLVTLWRLLRKISNCLHEISEIYQFVLWESSLVVLSNQWSKLDISIKRNMAKVLIQGSHILGSCIEGSARMCAALIMAIYDPWSEPILKKAVAGEDHVDELSFLEFLINEPEEVLDSRIQLLIKEENEEAALGFCQWSLKYLQNLASKENMTIKDASHPLDGTEIRTIAKEMKTYFFVWLILLLYRKEQVHNIVMQTSKCSCHEGVQLIHTMKSKKTTDSIGAAETLIHIFLVRDLLSSSDYCCTKELMTLWCEIQIQQDRTLEEIKEASYKLLVYHASTSAHFYLFIDCLWEKFGLKFLPLYLEMYIHGLTADLNHLEAARQSNDQKAILEMESHMAAILTKLSSLFVNQETIAHECILSAFSLEPTQQRLKLLQQLTKKIRNMKKQKECTCEGRCTTPSKELETGGESIQQNYLYHYSHTILDAEIQGVMEDQLHDFVTVLENVRIHYLKYSRNWHEMKQICEEYLKTASALRTLFSHNVAHENVDSEVVDLVFDNEVVARTEKPTNKNGNILFDGQFNNSSAKLPFDLLNRVHSNVLSTGKSKSHRKHHNHKDSYKKKSKLNKNKRRSDVKDIQKKKKKKRKLKQKKEHEDLGNKDDNNCEIVQKIKKKKKKLHKKMKGKSSKHKIQTPSETQMGSVDLATMISNNAGILVSKFHADFAMSSKFCNDSSELTSCLPESMNPIMVLSNLLTQKQTNVKRSHKTEGHCKKVKKNKSSKKLKNKHKLKKQKNKHKKNDKKFHKNKNVTEKCVTSYSMITSETEILENTNKSVLMIPSISSQPANFIIPHSSALTKLPMIEETLTENTERALTTCNIKPLNNSYAPITLFHTIPVIMPTSIPRPSSLDIIPPSLRKETFTRDGNRFYVSGIVKNITHSNSRDNREVVTSLGEPIKSKLTYSIGEAVSTCMLVEKKQTVVSRVNIAGINKQVTSMTERIETDKVSRNNFCQMTTCVEDKPVIHHTIITSTVPKQSVLIPPAMQGSIPVMTTKAEAFPNYTENMSQNVPTVATFTIPISPSLQNGAGNRVLAGRIVIPVSLNCTGVKNVFPTSALVQNQPHIVNNCSQQSMTIPGVIIVRSNNSNNKDIKGGKVEMGKVILPSSSSKSRRSVQTTGNKTSKARKTNRRENSSKRKQPSNLNSSVFPLPIVKSNTVKTSAMTLGLCTSTPTTCHSPNMQSNIQNLFKSYQNINNTVTTPTTVSAYNSKYLQLSMKKRPSKLHYSPVDLSCSRTPVCSSTAVSTPKSQATWNSVSSNCETVMPVLKSMQTESSNITSCTLTTVTACTRPIVTNTSMVSPIATPSTTVQQFATPSGLMTAENKLSSSSVQSTSDTSLQPIISSTRQDVISDGAMENNLLLMEQPNRSLSSISDAVRVSLMVMDDETGGAETQGMQTYPYDTPENIGYTDQQSTSATSSICNSFDVPRNMEIQQNSMILNGNQSTQLYQSVSSCQIMEDYNQQSTSPTSNWSSSINTHEETEDEDLRKKPCINTLNKEEIPVEETKKPKKESTKKTKDTSQSQTSPSSISNRFWCGTCQRGFFSAYNLRRHCKNVHKMELPSMRPVTETQNMFPKSESKLPEQACHDTTNSTYEISSPTTQSFPLCHRPQEDTSSRQNQSGTNVDHTVTDLSCVKQPSQKKTSKDQTSKVSSQKHCFNSNKSHSQLSSNSTFTHIRSNRQYPNVKHQNCLQFPSHSQSEFTAFSTNSSHMCNQSTSKHPTASATLVQQNTNSLCPSGSQSTPLSSGTSDSLEDLEQFLMENLSWSSDQGTAQNQHPERPASADSLSLPVNVESSPTKTVSSKCGSIQLNAKDECLVNKHQNNIVDQCNSNSKKDFKVNSEPYCSSKCSSTEQVNSTSKNKTNCDLPANSANRKSSVREELPFSSVMQRLPDKPRKNKIKVDTSTESTEKQDFEKILCLEKLSMSDTQESKPVKDSNNGWKESLGSKNGQERIPNENCLQDTFKDNKKLEISKSYILDNTEKLLTMSNNMHDSLNNNADQFKTHSELINKNNYKETEISRNGSPLALSDISHMLNECRIQKVSPTKGVVSAIDKISHGATHDDNYKPLQTELNESIEIDGVKEGLANMESIIARSDNIYHCKWDKEHYEEETNLTRGRTRSRDSCKILKRICPCCEDSDLVSRKCRKNSGSSTGSINAVITKTLKSNIKKSKQSSKGINSRNRRPCTRSTIS